MSFFIRVIGLCVFLVIGQSSALASKFVQYNAKTMAKVKQSIKDGSASDITLNTYKELINVADALLKQKAPSVVDKTFFPPSKNKHDYLSISRYWWPDPSKKEGLPWKRKDGVTNPSTQTDDVDRNRLGLMAKMTSALSLAYYFSEDEKYAKKTAEVIKTWFLNEATLMRPHLQYAQSVPGNPKGRRSGILDGRLIPKTVLDAIHMISTSPHWEQADTKKMDVWLTQYLAWLTKSKLGKKGAKQTNNHGSWYNFQVASLAYYLNDKAMLTQIINTVKESYAFQFDSKGAQPHELKRTRSYFYSCFNLDAMTRIAMISEKVNQSFWNYESSDGKSLALAINFLLPATEGADWAYKTKGVDPSYIAPLLARISKQSSNEKYPQVLRKILNDLKAIKSDSHHFEIYSRFALLEPQYF